MAPSRAPQAPGAVSIDTRPGRRTRFARVYRTRSINPDGVPSPWVEQEEQEQREIVGEDVIDGRTYVRERYRIDSNGETQEADTWYRQDRSGYYTYAGETLPTARKLAPPSGLAEGETTLLQYPVHRNASWVTGEESQREFTVEAIEWLDTPAGKFRAARVRRQTPGGDPETVNLTWYADPGIVKEFERFVLRRNGPGTPVILETEATSEITEYTPGQDSPAP